MSGQPRSRRRHALRSALLSAMLWLCVSQPLPHFSAPATRLERLQLTGVTADQPHQSGTPALAIYTRGFPHPEASSPADVLEPEFLPDQLRPLPGRLRSTDGIDLETEALHRHAPDHLPAGAVQPGPAKHPGAAVGIQQFPQTA